MKKEIYNPLFESILNTVKEYKPVHNYKVNEQAVADNEKFKKPEQAFKYIKDITDSWMGSILYFSGACPIEAVQKDMSKYVLEKMQAIKSNATIDDIINNFKEISKEIVNKINAQKKSKVIIPVYDEFLGGTKVLEEAYAAYKKRAGDMITTADLIKKINDHIKGSVDSAIKSTQTSNLKTS